MPLAKPSTWVLTLFGLSMRSWLIQLPSYSLFAIHFPPYQFLPPLSYWQMLSTSNLLNSILLYTPLSTVLSAQGGWVWTLVRMLNCYMLTGKLSNMQRSFGSSCKKQGCGGVLRRATSGGWGGGTVRSTTTSSELLQRPVSILSCSPRWPPGS